MGTTHRLTTRLISELLNSPETLDFFQAVRLVEEHSLQKNSHPVGYYHKMADESLHFKTALSLQFPTHDIAQIIKKKGDLYEMVVTFMGVFGQTGILPEHYTELMQIHEKNKHHLLSDFLNLFNHRAISFYYRAWERNNIYLSYQRYFKQAFSVMEGTKEDAIKDQHLLLYYAGFFSQYPRNVSNLESLLSDYFQLPLTVNSYQKSWQNVSPSEYSRVTKKQAQNQLGCDAFLGRKLLSFQNKIQILIGPLNYEQFGQLFPTGKMLKAICRVVKQYLNPGILFDIKLVLLPEQVPAFSLSHKPMMRLAWNTWLREEVHKLPKSDVIFGKHSFNRMIKREHNDFT